MKACGKYDSKTGIAYSQNTVNIALMVRGLPGPSYECSPRRKKMRLVDFAMVIISAGFVT